MTEIKKLIITDEDINWVENILGGDIVFDKSRRDIIKNMDSIDIQAFPGSGKTTILVAKLAILAKKWENPTSGICVLTHTNVAREEIQNRLGNTEIGASLLRYPHFIGTVHSFFNTFIGIPWVRSKGIPIEVIDTEFVCSYRWKMLDHKYKVYLEKKNKTYMSICYKNEIRNIELGNLKVTTPTYKNVEETIVKTQQNGYFTYEELLLLSKEAIQCNSKIKYLVENRFSLLFIDEAQDTNSFQWDLIKSVFQNSVQQGFGDENQAIYNYYGENESDLFPRENPLVLHESKRFNSQISDLTNPLAISKETMSGINPRFNCINTIFLFDVERIESVLIEYSKLLLDSFTDQELIQYSSDGCYAVGMVHTKTSEINPDQIPKGVFNYWDDYRHKRVSDRTDLKLLLEYFIVGRNELNSKGESYLQLKWILSGLRVLINTIENRIIIENKATLINSFLDKLNEEQKIDFKKHLLQLTMVNTFSESEWEETKKTIFEILDLFNICSTNIDFLKWSNDLSIIPKENNSKSFSPNTFKYSEENGRKVSINLGSIHSVKGQTHLSTLVLETFHYKHNMTSILPYISNQSSNKKINKRDVERLKCHYVAMTRARGLLCLALPKDNVDQETRENLIKLGWNIKDI